MNNVSSITLTDTTNRLHSSERINTILARLDPQEVEEFYQCYQAWMLQRQMETLRMQVVALQQAIVENGELMQQAQPSAIASATLAQLQARGVSDIDLLDKMLARGESWLDHTMQLLAYCERYGVIGGDYTEWCEHSLEGAYDWINSVGQTGTLPGESTEQVEDLDRDDATTEAQILQKLMSDGDETEKQQTAETSPWGTRVMSPAELLADIVIPATEKPQIPITPLAALLSEVGAQVTETPAQKQSAQEEPESAAPETSSGEPGQVADALVLPQAAETTPQIEQVTAAADTELPEQARIDSHIEQSSAPLEQVAEAQVTSAATPLEQLAELARQQEETIASSAPVEPVGEQSTEPAETTAYSAPAELLNEQQAAEPAEVETTQGFTESQEVHASEQEVASESIPIASTMPATDKETKVELTTAGQPQDNQAETTPIDEQPTRALAVVKPPRHTQTLTMAQLEGQPSSELAIISLPPHLRRVLEDNFDEQPSSKRAVVSSPSGPQPVIVEAANSSSADSQLSRAVGSYEPRMLAEPTTSPERQQTRSPEIEEEQTIILPVTSSRLKVAEAPEKPYQPQASLHATQVGPSSSPETSQKEATPLAEESKEEQPKPGFFQRLWAMLAKLFGA
ncbi:hypothetical protein EPA93_40855 [Ktedonosporobacter rubrisoli]|uniref:Uncharacterized protein n=1 Tax=Ktedonosporobacter rubrisoli TaxID=2509675 RepID=A0A4P6K278_KTERU|nr:hypothetical protein [Ktedonosporobacter rubrisoli]QBD81992.1 hypothetical protein EPA93_40855 [Ktedonosporobacter rubrisoli]